MKNPDPSNPLGPLEPVYRSLWKTIHGLEGREKDTPVPTVEDLARRLGLISPDGSSGSQGQKVSPLSSLPGSNKENKDPQKPQGPGQRAWFDALDAQIQACTDCELHKSRANGVTGDGVEEPLVLFIGEGPGAQEDKQGKPFVGPAGQYLDKWLQAIGLSRRSNVYITNIVKCRPPQNRDPIADEIASCAPYLEAQIEKLNPPVIVTLGRFALSALVDKNVRIGQERGTWTSYRSIPLLPMYHPAAVLRNPQLKAEVWQDLKNLRAYLEEHFPGYLGPMAGR